MDKIGHYQLDGLIAEGGMAKIYRARVQSVGNIERVVALKVLRENFSKDENLINALFNEAKLLSAMNHKNICRVMGLEHFNGTYFIVMEYVDGLDLSRILRHFSEYHQLMPLEAAIYITMEICAGLSYAHRLCAADGTPLNLTHRDINPQNVLISREGEVKLIDFGIAKANNTGEQTQVGVIKGKFNYMSPEQARGDKLDGRSDVYALGCVLYTMLHGTVPFRAKKPLDVALMHIEKPFPTCSEKFPSELRAIIAKCTSKRRSQRYQSINELAQALQAFLEPYECRSLKHNDWQARTSVPLSKQLEDQNEINHAKTAVHPVPSFEDQTPKIKLNIHHNLASITLQQKRLGKNNFWQKAKNLFAS